MVPHIQREQMLRLSCDIGWKVQAKEGAWREQHSIYIGTRDDIEGDYSQLLSRSKFCLVAPGGCS